MSTNNDLLAAALRACDHHGDGPAAREEMRAACLATPHHLKANLLAHFDALYPSAGALQPVTVINQQDEERTCSWQ